MFAALLLLSSSEEKKEFEELYYRYREPMFRIANSILYDSHMAEDAVSEAFLAIARHFDKIQSLPENSRVGYCVIVTRNQAITIYRKRQNRVEQIGIPTTIPAEEESRELREADFRQAMQNLPDKFKDVLLLKYHYGFTVQEIADILSLNLETTRSRLQTARKRVYPLLKRQIASDSEERQGNEAITV